MMPIRKISVEHFRSLENQEIDFQGKRINAIIGQNASMKTTILGMIATSFALKSSAMASETMIDGGGFDITLSEKFKFSPEFDLPGEHQWTLYLDKRISTEPFHMKSYNRTNGKLRFWKPGEREKGDSLIQCPAVFLSLKRLSPIGEEKRLSLLNGNITEEEMCLFRDWHNEILISTETIKDSSIIKSSSKGTIAPKTEYYDGFSISAGQDNIGRIILAVLSLRRLKEKYPNDYKGSVICIDELESTLYPASQIKMIDFIQKVSQQYSIQFFFTTHSMTIIRALFDNNVSQYVSITYAKKTGREVKIFNELPLSQIESDLYIRKTSRLDQDKIKVYCEDDVASSFVKYLVGKKYSQKEHLLYENDDGANLGCTNLLFLLKHKIPDLLNNIIVLDGDVKTKPEIMSKIKIYKNVVILPTEEYPEKIIYNCLRNLPDEDAFWDNQPGGFSKQSCFMNYTKDNLSEKEIKKWFVDIRSILGRGFNRIIQKAFEDKEEEKRAFTDEFTQAYDYVKTKRL